MTRTSREITTPHGRRTLRGAAVVIVRLLVSAAALTIAVAGIPYALLLSVGAPWPEQVHSLDDLAGHLGQPVSDTFILHLLAYTAWTFWAYAMAILARETLGVVRHFPELVRETGALRLHAAALPAHRAAAALLVGTLLLALVGLWRLPTAHAATTTGGPLPLQRVVATAPQHPAAPSAQEGERHRGEPKVPAYVQYTVEPGDTLWDIAAAHLGDPVKWPRIYQLSCTIRQSNGELLSDPDLIRPGWELRIPAAHDRTPPHEPDGPKPDRPAPKPEPAPTPSTPPSPETATPHQQAAPPTKPARHPEQRPESDTRASAQRPVTIGVGGASFIGITTAAGITAALAFARRRAARHREPTLGHDEVTSEPALDTAVQRAHHGTLSARSARHDTDDDLPRMPQPAEPLPAGTVSIAECAGREVLVDALSVPGGVHLTGPGAEDATRALTIAIATAAQRLRPGLAAVRLLIPAATLARLLPAGPRGFAAGWSVTDDFGTAVDAAEHALLEHARHEQGVSGSELVHDEATASAMSVFLADVTALGNEQGPRLAALAARAAPGRLAVLTLGSASRTSTAVHVQEDGSAHGDIPALSSATLFTLAPTPAAELLTTLLAAHGQQVQAADTDPPAPAQNAPPATTKAPRPSAAPTVQDNTLQGRQEPDTTSRPVHLRLFGGFALTIRGEECVLADARKEGTREYLSLLAAHPGGLHAEEIADKMNLSGSPEERNPRIANLRRAARRLLRDATGTKSPAFVVLSGDRQRLDPQLVATDTSAFIDALRQAAAETTTYARADALRRAAETYRGPLCDGADYLWVEGPRLALHRQAVDALMLLADHMAQHSADPEPALALLNQAADFDPTNERVYRRIIKLQRAVGRDDAAHRTLALLTHRLADIDEHPEPATTALLHDAPQATVAR
ncbi:LysM peptidoglycan-binding domain-containing protein [Streptomyces sp. NBC_00006]|uniref:BTAD domain-containing putative transcriptional regulator n=1 Tax=unclassified Streptomyces TaxID=2593676 RepID=UPI00224E4E9C|nr:MULTISPECIES: BTAD domain-containing putative transcriptional regulator [unclassified Streptomyces]MCX4834224.1 LysM peptidoglycan-binding domain-containing protein [Streptomyces sp. NBC_01016]MCX5529860.1 LysM peptidoglycan-binding domain-containing protein [Streptomyces sp. NBC_00006]